MSHRTAPRGARLLREYLTDKNKSLHAFCRDAKLDYAWVYRHLSGERDKRISVDFAQAIHAATKGAVPWHSWSKDARESAPRAA